MRSRVFEVNIKSKVQSDLGAMPKTPNYLSETHMKD
jgi:hypothetical protein